MSAENSRLFFALSPDSQIRSGIAKIQSALNPFAKPVPVANIHMTLVFLGTVHIERIPLLHEIAVRLDFPEFEIVLDRTGRFRQAAIGWLGCSMIPNSLRAFQADLNLQIQAAGFKSDTRAWKPHITLYRDLRIPFETIDFEALRWKPRSFCLMQSRHDRSGLVYQPIGHWTT